MKRPLMAATLLRLMHGFQELGFQELGFRELVSQEDEAVQQSTADLNSRSVVDSAGAVLYRHFKCRGAVSTFIPAEFSFFLLEPDQLFADRLHKTVTRRYGNLRVSHHRPQGWLAPLDPIQFTGTGKGS